MVLRLNDDDDEDEEDCVSKFENWKGRLAQTADTFIQLSIFNAGNRNNAFNCWYCIFHGFSFYFISPWFVWFVSLKYLKIDLKSKIIVYVYVHVCVCANIVPKKGHHT